MSVRLKDRSIIPPGGYYSDVPETKQRVTWGDFDGLLEAVVCHLRANRKPIPSRAELEARLEAEICARVPQSFLASGDPLAIQQPTRSSVTTSEKIAALKRIWERHGSLLVDRHVAEERAVVCRYCPKNVSTACLSCNGVLSWLRTTFDLPSMAIDTYLHTCAVHSVYNKAQVHLADAVFIEQVPKAAIVRYPEACWKRKLLEAHYAKESASVTDPAV